MSGSWSDTNYGYDQISYLNKMIIALRGFKKYNVKIVVNSNIPLDNSEIDKMTEELNNIMKWVEALNEVDIEDVQPMPGVSSMTLREREDKVTDGGLEDKILSNAPEKIDGSFTVPKVIE